MFVTLLSLKLMSFWCYCCSCWLVHFGNIVVSLLLISLLSASLLISLLLTLLLISLLSTLMHISLLSTLLLISSLLTVGYFIVVSPLLLTSCWYYCWHCCQRGMRRSSRHSPPARHIASLLGPRSRAVRTRACPPARSTYSMCRAGGTDVRPLSTKCHNIPRPFNSATLCTITSYRGTCSKSEPFQASAASLGQQCSHVVAVEVTALTTIPNLDFLRIRMIRWIYFSRLCSFELKNYCDELMRWILVIFIVGLFPIPY